MKRILILFGVAMVSVPAWAGGNAFVPPAGKTLLFIGQDADTIAHYVHATHTTPGGTMLYTSIQEMKGLNGVNSYGAGPQDGNALLRRYPHSAVQIGLYMVGALYPTTQGQYDNNLKALAQWIKSAGRPVYLRIGYEFDNPQNFYDPQLYVQAFRYVVDFLRRQGVTNAAYVWHSYCWTPAPGRTCMDWYPGDDYVDWFGVTLFTTPSQIWLASDFLTLARGHHKPFMIAEATPCGMYTVRGKIEWMKNIFHFIEDQNIEAFCYINSDWDSMPMFSGRHFGDARVEVHRETKDFWLKEINQDRYLN